MPPERPGGAEASQPRPAGERLRLAREALARARAAAQARGHRPAQQGSGQASQRGTTAGTRRGRRDDPQPLNAAIGGLVEDQGWAMAAATGSVFARWPQIVGPELAAHTSPGSLADGELIVLADSTAWATQVRLLAAQLVRRLNAELGDGAVRRVQVRGPSGPPRQPGQWRVRGGRGPRDTYG
ncbi:MAG TPA: DciA family protein [Streptosporangiaceae bacterium]